MTTINPLGGHELLLLIVQFGLLLLVARTLGEVAKRFRLASVVGELLAGFVLGPSLPGAVAPGTGGTVVAGRHHAVDPDRLRHRPRADRRQRQGSARDLPRRYRPAVRCGRRPGLRDPRGIRGPGRPAWRVRAASVGEPRSHSPSHARARWRWRSCTA